MSKRLSLLSLAAVLALALSLPAVAQTTATPPAGASTAGSAPASDMSGKKPMHHHHHHHHGKAAMTSDAKPASHNSHHKWSCYDYAWESQQQKDCLAKQEAGGMKSGGHKGKSKKPAAT
jgi:hypothetical protein